MRDDDPDVPSTPAKDDLQEEPAPVAPTPSEDPAAQNQARPYCAQGPPGGRLAQWPGMAERGRRPGGPSTHSPASGLALNQALRPAARTPAKLRGRWVSDDARREP